MSFKSHDKSSPVNSTHYAVLYPQNGDSIVAIDSVTSLHPICIPFNRVQRYAVGDKVHMCVDGNARLTSIAE